MNYLQLALWSLAAGAFIPVMGALNGGLARHVGGPIPAALILISVGWLAMLTLFLVTRQIWPKTAVLMSARPHLYLAGLVVFFYVISATVLAPRFGVGNFILFAMTAQILSATAIDAFGLFSAPVKPIGLVRAVGIVAMIGGLALTQVQNVAPGAGR